LRPGFGVSPPPPPPKLRQHFGGWSWEILERKDVGAGVFEYRIDFGPGYRVYFGKDGGTIVIL
jgi:putative addiction module killer protein